MEVEPEAAILAGESPENKSSTSNKKVRRIRLERHRYKGVLSAEKLRQMRSLNPFRAFLNEKRAKMKKELPELAARDIVSKVAAIWNNLPEEEKGVYRAMIAKERRRVIESWGDEFATAILDEKRANPKKQCRPKHSVDPSGLESTVAEVINRGNEKKAPLSASKEASTSSGKRHYRFPPSLAYCAEQASPQQEENSPVSVKVTSSTELSRLLDNCRISAPKDTHAPELQRIEWYRCSSCSYLPHMAERSRLANSGVGQRSSARPGARSVKELLEAARAKKAQQEEAQIRFEREQYLWDYQSCLEGKSGARDEVFGSASDADSNFLKYNHSDSFKDCFLQSFVAFDRRLDGEEHRLASRDASLRKQLAAVTKELAIKRDRDEKVKVFLNNKEQEVTDALLWTDFIYRTCLTNALKHIRIPGFPSAATTENVFQLLRAAANLVKQNDPRNRRFIHRFKAIMAKLTMPKTPC